MSVIGIDLGTSQSSGCFTYGKDDQNKEKYIQVVNELIRSCAITRSDNEKAHPSYVQYDRNGKFIVAGIRAKHLASISPKTTIYDSKRPIGRRFDDPEVQKFKKILDERGHYEICANDKEEAAIKIGDTQKSPEEVSSEIILDILKDAFAQEINLRIDHMVISVPAYFNEIQKSRTKKAAILAIKKLQNTEYIKRIQIELGDERPENIKDIELIPEPTAALITYMAKTGLKEIPKGKYILVFDLGAGTLDISIGTAKRIRNPRGGEEYELDIKTTYGDTILGGRDMDQKIIEWVESELRKRNISIDSKILSDIRDKAEKAKILLSSREKTAIRLDDENNEISLDRKKLEELISSILERCREVIRKALKIGGIRKEDIAVIVMVGGPTKMPSVRRLVEEEVGIKIADVTGWDPMQCVAEGAARHATGEGNDYPKIVFDYYIAPVMFDYKNPGINVGTKIVSVGDPADVDCNVEIFVPSNASEGLAVIKLRMVRRTDTNLTCIQEILLSVASQVVDRSDEHCKIKKIKYSGKMLNEEYLFRYEKVKINFRINNEGLMMMPGFTQTRNGNKIIYPDLPVEDKGSIELADWPTFFDRDWDKLAREFLKRVDDRLAKGIDDDGDGIDPNKIPLNDLKLMAKEQIRKTNELKSSETLTRLIKHLEEAIILANDTPSKKSNLINAILAIQKYMDQQQAMS